MKSRQRVSDKRARESERESEREREREREEQEKRCSRCIKALIPKGHADEK
jgi:hypothetical protein